MRTAASDTGYWILQLHGNADSAFSTWQVRHCEALRRVGFSVLDIDYRGFGLTPGVASEAGMYEDAEAAYKALLLRGVPPGRIICWATPWAPDPRCCWRPATRLRRWCCSAHLPRSPMRPPTNILCFRCAMSPRAVRFAVPDERGAHARHHRPQPRRYAGPVLARPAFIRRRRTSRSA